MDAPPPTDPSQTDPSQTDPGPPDHPDAPDGGAPVEDGRTGLDIATIGLLVFFIALIGIVAALLLLPILTGCCR